MLVKRASTEYFSKVPVYETIKVNSLFSSEDERESSLSPESSFSSETDSCVGDECALNEYSLWKNRSLGEVVFPNQKKSAAFEGLPNLPTKKNDQSLGDVIPTTWMNSSDSAKYEWAKTPAQGIEASYHTGVNDTLSSGRSDYFKSPGAELSMRRRAVRARSCAASWQRNQPTQGFSFVGAPQDAQVGLQLGGVPVKVTPCCDYHAGASTLSPEAPEVSDSFRSSNSEVLLQARSRTPLWARSSNATTNHGKVNVNEGLVTPNNFPFANKPVFFVPSNRYHNEDFSRTELFEETSLFKDAKTETVHKETSTRDKSESMPDTLESNEFCSTEANKSQHSRECINKVCNFCQAREMLERGHPIFIVDPQPFVQQKGACACHEGKTCYFCRDKLTKTSFSHVSCYMFGDLPCAQQRQQLLTEQRERIAKSYGMSMGSWKWDKPSNEVSVHEQIVLSSGNSQMPTLASTQESSYELELIDEEDDDSFEYSQDWQSFVDAIVGEN